MSEHPNAAVIRSAYEAMDNADVAAFAALLDDDITWYESTSGMAGVYRRRDEVMAFLGQVFQSGMQMSVAIHDILANDEHAVILHESTSRSGTAATPATLPTSTTCGRKAHGALALGRRCQGGRRIRLRSLRKLAPRRDRSSAMSGSGQRRLSELGSSGSRPAARPGPLREGPAARVASGRLALQGSSAGIGTTGPEER